jgi:hypothetical protein
VTNLLSGFIGAIVGAVVALVGSIWATKSLTSHERDMESDRELRLHKAAARSVLLELIINLANLYVADRAPIRPLLQTVAYDNGVLPLFSLLPEDVSGAVAAGYAFARLWNADPRVTVAQANELLIPAKDKLQEYAEAKLGISMKNIRAGFGARLPSSSEGSSPPT